MSSDSIPNSTCATCQVLSRNTISCSFLLGDTLLPPNYAPSHFRWTVSSLPSSVTPIVPVTIPSMRWLLISPSWTGSLTINYHHLRQTSFFPPCTNWENSKWLNFFFTTKENKRHNLCLPETWHFNGTLLLVQFCLKCEEYRFRQKKCYKLESKSWRTKFYKISLMVLRVK